MQEFIDYLFNDLKDRLEQIKEEAYKPEPDLEIVDYHFIKAEKIIDLIKNQQGAA